MNYLNEDSVMMEVRKNRANLLSEHDGDIKKYIEHIIAQKPTLENGGWQYETEAELEARKSWHRQQHEAEQHRIKAI